MKTNITINLFGQLYHIDEDAYGLLKQYEENMSRYFSKKDGGEEIIDDIEHRVAELLAELKANGNIAINIEQIQEIIRRIGNPEQIEEESEDPGAHTQYSTQGPTCPPPIGQTVHHQQQQPHRQHRLFRDVKDAMLGGVSSGLSHYFGIDDPIIFRIAWIALLFLPYCPAFIIYVILWIVIPPAVTPEERLMMYGKSVTPENINEEIINASQTQNSYQKVEKESLFHRILNPLLSICAVVFKAIIIFILALFLFFAFSVIIALFGVTISTPSLFTRGLFFDPTANVIFNALYAQSWQIWFLAIAAILTIGMPLFALIHRILKKDNQPTNKKRRNFSFLVWITALITTILLSISIAVNTGIELDEQQRLENTRNGIYLNNRSWNILDEGNWNMEKIENANPKIYRYCTNLFTHNREVGYIQVRNDRNNEAMKCTIQRNVEAEAGTYIIEAIAKSRGDGCYLFSQTADSANIHLTLVPGNCRNNTEISDMSWTEAQTTPYFKNSTDSLGWEQVQKNSRDAEWGYVKSAPFHHNGGYLKYGITNDRLLTLKTSHNQEFSFYDIVLTKISEE